MSLVESTCCMNCHRLLQRITAIESYLLDFQNRWNTQQIVITDPLSIQAGESCESQQFIPSVEEQAETDRQTNRWHKQGARPKGSQDIRLSRVSRIAAVASSTPDTAMTRLANNTS